MLETMVKVLAVASVVLMGSEALAEKKKVDWTPRQVNGVVNINTATAREIAQLPGIGLPTAKRVVAYREKQPFKSAEEIVKVQGVGEKTYRKVRSHLTVSGTTTLTALPRSKPAPAMAPRAAVQKPAPGPAVTQTGIGIR